ncbi:MAG: TIGR01777 family oxidoreductase [Actinobacteria bacterium]|nr:TIGR01777 family oxidoreductase [Actinomycetota bacterium]
MPTLVATTALDHPPQTVFEWHTRPGAFQRLTPPGFGRVESEASAGLAVGSRATLRVAVPGMRLPGLPPASVRWVARHDSFDPPRSFSDVMESGPMASWRHHRTFEPRPSGAEPAGGTELVERVSYELPAPGRLPGIGSLAGHVMADQLGRFFAYRGRTLRDDLAFHAAHAGRGLVVAVAGSSGLVGRQLVALLGGGGHDVRRLTRGRPGGAGTGEIRWDPARGELDPAALADVDVVVNLAGEPVAGRFTDDHLRRVRESRVVGTGLLARALATLAADGRPRALINASASGYYGPDRGDQVLTEESGPGRGVLADIVRDWEAATEPAQAAGVRVALVRTGIVQSPAGGQLGLQLPIFTAGLGGPLGDGQAWMPWITIDDLVGIYAHLIVGDASGPVNAAAPTPVTGAEYARTLASVVHRPGVLRVPALAPAVLLGRRGADEFALAGQRMSAARATELGYSFRHPELRTGLEHVLARTTDGPTEVEEH